MSALILHVGKARGGWWKTTMKGHLPDLDVYLWDDDLDPAEVEFAVVWKHPPGGLLRFPNLKAIISIGAGVDHVLVDPDLPHGVPLIRTTGDDLTQRMREYVCLQVLRLHRNVPDLEEGRRLKEWRQGVNPPATLRGVGVMGLGNLGADCARTLSMIGFDVSGWARSGREVECVRVFAGQGGLSEFLARSEILVCLLPLTPETEGILNLRLFEQLPEGARLINCARGPHLVEEDLIPALNAGQLSRAVLDVFNTEPLPQDHPFWDDPRIDITPHVASLIDPGVGGRLIAENIRRFRAGEPVPDLVDLAQGY